MIDCLFGISVDTQFQQTWLGQIDDSGALELLRTMKDLKHRPAQLGPNIGTCAFCDAAQG